MSAYEQFLNAVNELMIFVEENNVDYSSTYVIPKIGSHNKFGKLMFEVQIAMARLQYEATQ